MPFFGRRDGSGKGRGLNRQGQGANPRSETREKRKKKCPYRGTTSGVRRAIRRK